MNRILVVRGGAIGDFILTLPALKILREAYPAAQIEILGYSHIAEIANNRFYANAVRSIEYALLSRFFGRNTELPDELADYFSKFDVVVSYLFDPDLIFENNLRRSGVEEIVRGPGKILESGGHATKQLATPMREFGLELIDSSARIFPSEGDSEFAREFLKGLQAPFVAVHPGSGSAKKNWPLEKWIQLIASTLSETTASIIVVSGEADEKQTKELRARWPNEPRLRFAPAFSLPRLGAILEKTVFVGHDSGISHLAAAAGAQCVLLFGPTDPAVWGPQGEHVKILAAPGNALHLLPAEAVLSALSRILG